MRHRIPIEEHVIASAGPPKSGATATGEAMGASPQPGGLPNHPDDNIWETLTNGKMVRTGQLGVYIEKLDSDHAFRRGQVAEFMAKAINQLQRLPDTAEGDREVGIAAGDLVLITHLLLRHQP